MKRSLYRSVLWLHPPAFRREFAGEMLWIFDEAAGEQGTTGLILDGIRSVLRQWIASGVWKVLLALAAATAELLFIAPLANVREVANSRHDLPVALTSADVEFSRGLLLVFILLVGMITALRVLHARTPSRH